MVFKTSVFVVFALVIQEGLTLRCWKCSSQYDATCRDYFNTSRILLNNRQMDPYTFGNLQPARTDPHVTECEGMHTSTMGQMKNVCLKRVLTVPHGPNEVIRECRMVHQQMKVGACPDELLNSPARNMEFCGSCEHDGCNSAPTATGALLGALMPTFLLLILRK
ncbi:uncharacterized protein LOC126740384 [Anthonomus grandis grandis]|uniref:uncharacterized protein LOC126740384 n=1 Tax=Anthonomus grandis grandis TaxID=2921223 RepID=UPI002166998B|nr:uncharacterized protein LOC126740384 [Anthonomus grandis grandis]